jgi:hypothetical protein
MIYIKLFFFYGNVMRFWFWSSQQHRWYAPIKFWDSTLLPFEFEVDILIRATAAMDFRSLARMVSFATSHIVRSHRYMLQITHAIVQMQRHPCRKQGVNGYKNYCKKSAHKTKIGFSMTRDK